MPFDPREYMTRNPTIQANWDADPSYEAFYGTIENYAIEAAAGWGTDEDKAMIFANDIVVPPGQTLEPNEVGTIQSQVPQRYLDEYARITSGPNPDPRDFNTWLDDHMRETGDNAPDLMSYVHQTPQAVNPDPTAPVTPPDTVTEPAEQAIYNTIAPGIIQDIENDQLIRRPIADESARTINTALGNATRINDSLVPKLDYVKYLTENPDVAQAYTSVAGPDGFAVVNGERMNPEQFANYHYETSGRAENRPASFSTQRLNDENAQSRTFTDEAIAAANERDATMRGATQGAVDGLNTATQDRMDMMNRGTVDAQETLGRTAQELADAKNQNTITARQGMDDATEAWLREMYGGTETAINTLQGGLADQLALQRQGTETSRTEQEAALAAQVAARRAALEQEANDLRGVVGVEADARRAALAQEIAGLTASQNQFSDARQANLMAEIEGLRGIAGTTAASRRAALEQELLDLRAAQDPVNQARLAAAETQGSTINQGLERTLDGIVARQAQQGFVGTDSFTDSALLRATLEARQGAAGAVQGARVANAMDDRSIAVRGANDKRTIEDELTRNNESLGQRGVSGTRVIGDERAGGLFSIDNRKATEGRTIEDALAGANSVIGKNLATGNRTLSDYNADEGRGITNWASDRNLSLTDLEATGGNDIVRFGAERNLGILDAGANSKQGNALFSVNRNLDTSDELAGTNSDIGKFGAERNLGVVDMGAEEFANNSRFGINRNLGITDSTAEAVGAARNAGSLMRQNYFDADLGRSLEAALRPVSMEGDRINALDALDTYANSGTRRGLDTLNWFSGNAAPVNFQPFQQAPNTTMGDFWGSTGAGITNIAGNVLLSKYANKAPATTPNVNASKAPTTPVRLFGPP